MHADAHAERMRLKRDARRGPGALSASWPRVCHVFSLSRRYLARQSCGALREAGSGRLANERTPALRRAACRLKERLTVTKAAEVDLPAELCFVTTEGADAFGGGDGDARGGEGGSTVGDGAMGGEGERVEMLLDGSDVSLSVEEVLRRAQAGEFGGGAQTAATKWEGDADGDADGDVDGSVAGEGLDSPTAFEAGAGGDAPAGGSSAPPSLGHSLSLSREEMETACAELLQRARDPVIKACAQAQVPLAGAAGGKEARAAANKAGGGGGRSAPRLVRPSTSGQRIDCVLRVGAASRMPAVETMLERLVGVPCPLGGVRPEHAVALGAAVQAGVLEGSLEQFDVFSPFEAALIRGIGAGTRRSQRERTGEPSGSRRKKRRRPSIGRPSSE